MMALSIGDLWKLRTEFADEYEKLMEDAGDRMQRAHNLKMKAMEHA